MGASTSSEASVVVAVLAPYRCSVVPAAQPEGTFSMCYSASSPQLLHLVRVDAPHGWEALRLSCVAEPSGNEVQQTQAASPKWLTLSTSSSDALVARFDTNVSIGSCACAAPRLQLRADGSLEWLDARGACTSFGGTTAPTGDGHAASVRQCVAAGLLPDMRYEARLQIACGSEALSSGFTAAQAPAATRPPCVSLTDSGVKGHIQCADAFMCDAGDVAEDIACCAKHGGHIRCNPESPWFCAAGECVATADECQPHGGLRGCQTGDFMPAGAPGSVIVIPDGDGGLEVTWAPAEFLAGPSSCLFYRWSVEVAQVVEGELGSWEPASGCVNIQSRLVTSCNVKGLTVGASHRFRVSEVCSVALLTSPPTEGSTYHVLVPAASADEQTQELSDALPSGSAAHFCNAAPMHGTSTLPISACHESLGGLVRVTRTDAFSGWERLWLTCAPVPQNGVEPAVAPGPLQLVAPERRSLIAKFELPVAPVCSCASLRLELRASVTEAWELAGEHCSDVTIRECKVQGLQPDTLYYARLRIDCGIEALSSTFAPTVGPIATMKGEVVIVGSLLALWSGEAPSSVALVAAVATVAGVPRRVVSVEISDQDGSFLLSYMVAIATLRPDIRGGESAAAASAALVVGRLVAPSGPEAVAAALGLGSDGSILESDAPRLEVLSLVFPRCGDPPRVSAAAASWSPAACRYDMWSSDPCTVPCDEGVVAAGEYRCGIDGQWQGEPTCQGLWGVGAWSDCDSTCGSGMRHRTVTCSASSEANCIAVKPAMSAACSGAGKCAWVAEPWSACSGGCSQGVRSRAVSCPSGVPADCGQPIPAAVELCTSATQCDWRTGEWSQCNSRCGVGQQTRSVWCPGSDDGASACVGTAPSGKQDCHATQGCVWITGTWSDCVGKCGQGKRNRTLQCSSGNASYCIGQGLPSAEEKCSGTSTCIWTAAEWGECSSNCGWGTRSREVTCGGGADEVNCAQDTRPWGAGSCKGSGGCDWHVTDWSPCTSTCGSGISVRNVSCPSGTIADCAGAAPAASKECRGVNTCAWHLGTWSECSSSCGDGELTRSVWCPSGLAEDCEAAVGDLPTLVKACSASDGCGWDVGAWAACSTSCGDGYKTRSASCVSADCASPGPSVQGSCSETSGCSWAVGAWQECSVSCGSGLRPRDVACSSGDFVDCLALGPAPSAHEFCEGDQGCSWNMSEWSKCSSACGSGTRIREVRCPSGNNADCGESDPPIIEHCTSTEACSWLQGEWSECTGSCGNGVQTRVVSCASGTAQDCAQAKPDAQRPCVGLTPDDSAWQVDHWSECSTQCGRGVQSRSVFCPAALQGEDCSGTVPSSKQECRETFGCSWVSSDWSNCSSPCGLGFRHRGVSCSSDSESDCEHLPRPMQADSCVGDSRACTWSTGSWGDCSVSHGCGGQGIRVRTVACSSYRGASFCQGVRPLASETCISDASCAWRAGEWSGCDGGCGWGVATRLVTCAGDGVGVNCSGAKPSAEQECLESAACDDGWAAGNWSACSESCGSGQQFRSVSCRGGNCGGTQPRMVRACYSTSSCAWEAGSWSACGAKCGQGLQQRDVSCSSGRDEDCPAEQKLMHWQPCREVASCVWLASPWSLCSAACGAGTQQRVSACNGGSDADCADSSTGDGAVWSLGGKPIVVQPCRATCLWQTSAWSTCSSSCGSGIETREAWCASGREEDCHGEKPPTTRECHESDGCCWATEEWLACSTECGWGTQRRSVTCSAAAPELCQGLGPNIWQRCRSTSSCRWNTEEWGACTSQCGSGLRTRKSQCADAPFLTGWCAGAQPADTESCSEFAGCAWQTSDWTPCGPACGPEMRYLRCPTGNSSTCSGIPQPVAVRPCTAATCSIDPGSVVSFGLRLSFGDPAAAEALDSVADSAAVAVATVLVRTIDSVRVTVTSQGSRRLTEGGLQRRVALEVMLRVEVVGAGLGDIALLASDTGGATLLGRMRDELVDRNVNVVGFDVSVEMVDLDVDAPSGSPTLGEVHGDGDRDSISDVTPSPTPPPLPAVFSDAASPSVAPSSEDSSVGALAAIAAVSALVLVTCAFLAYFRCRHPKLFKNASWKLTSPRSTVIANFRAEPLSEDDGDVDNPEGMTCRNAWSTASLEEDEPDTSSGGGAVERAGAITQRALATPEIGLSLMPQSRTALSLPSRNAGPANVGPHTTEGDDVSELRAGAWGTPDGGLASELRVADQGLPPLPAAPPPNRPLSARPKTPQLQTAFGGIATSSPAPEELKAASRSTTPLMRFTPGVITVGVVAEPSTASPTASQGTEAPTPRTESKGTSEGTRSTNVGSRPTFVSPSAPWIKEDQGTDEDFCDDTDMYLVATDDLTGGEASVVDWQDAGLALPTLPAIASGRPASSSSSGQGAAMPELPPLSWGEMARSSGHLSVPSGAPSARSVPGGLGPAMQVPRLSLEASSPLALPTPSGADVWNSLFAQLEDAPPHGGGAGEDGEGGLLVAAEDLTSRPATSAVAEEPLGMENGQDLYLVATEDI